MLMLDSEHTPYWKIFVQLLNILQNKLLIEVGIKNSDYIFLAAQYGWLVEAFETHPMDYINVKKKIQKNELDNRIILIYTHLGLHPSLDHFVSKKKIGLMKINGEIFENQLILGLRYSLKQQLIDCLMIDICPKLRPTIHWMETILYLETFGYSIYHWDFSERKLEPFELKEIHYTQEITLFFVKNNILVDLPLLT
jgi:hypothetical protein